MSAEPMPDETSATGGAIGVFLFIVAVGVMAVVFGRPATPPQEFCKGEIVTIKATGKSGLVVRVYVRDEWDQPYFEYRVRYTDNDGAVQHIDLYPKQLGEMP